MPRPVDFVYLDGLKGLAIVLLVLNAYLNAVGFTQAWGWGLGAIFWVVSGYVLSLQPLRHIQEHAWDKLLDTITSYVFRRYLRLMVPCLAVVTLAFSLIRLGFYDFTRPKTFPNFGSRPGTNDRNGEHELWRKTMFSLLWPFVWTFEDTPLVPPLWSINVMYRNSMFVFCLLMGSARCRERIRQLLIITCMLLSWRSNQFELFSTLGGVFLSQSRQAKTSSSTNSSAATSLDLESCNTLVLFRSDSNPRIAPPHRLNMLTRWTYLATFLTGLFLCISIDLGTSPAPSEKRAGMIQHVGAILVVWAVERSLIIESFLVKRLPRYFGQLSFAIYLTHHIIIQIVGQRVAAAIIGSSERSMLYALGTVLGLCVSAPVLVLFAHITHLYVNGPIIAATKWLESVCADESRLSKYSLITEIRATHEAPSPLLGDNLMANSDELGSTKKPGPITPSTFEVFVNVAWFLLPSFLTARLQPRTATSKKLYPTAWIDSLRGFASYGVYSYHLLYFYPNANHPWGYDEENKYFFQLPIINLTYNGGTMIVIFFMISGYVLSFSALKQIRGGSSRQRLSNTISSALFRRGPRLFLPPLAVTFCTMLLLHMGFFDSSNAIAKNPAGGLEGTLVSRAEGHPVKKGSFWAELRSWIVVSKKMTDFFTWNDTSNKYDPHLWTINLELHGSLLVFIYLIAFSRTKNFVRMGLLILSALFLEAYDLKWGLKNITMNILLFSLGLLLAEINIQQSQAGSWPLPKRMQRIKIPTFFTRFFWWFMFFFSLYLASAPTKYPWNYPFFTYLPKLVWKAFYQRLGCFLLILTISNSEQIQDLFMSRVAQYLGNISFALYITHFTLIHTIGYRIVKAFGILFVSSRGDLYFNLAWVAGYCVTSVLAIWVADVGWRLFDIPSVTFMKWLEKKSQ